MRTLRRARGLTLKELGARAGLSHPFLSQVERGLARPSVTSMERIAGALGVPAGVLLSAPPREGRVLLVPRDAGAFQRHAAVTAPGGVRTLPREGTARVREWTGGSRSWPPDSETAAGELLVYVARGGVEVDVGGEVHALGEGDALLFDAARPHRLRRTGGVATRALLVCSPG